MDFPQRLQGKQLRVGVLQPELLSHLFVCARGKKDGGKSGDKRN